MYRSGSRRLCAAMEREFCRHANLARPAHANGRRRRGRCAHFDSAELGDDASNCSADDWVIVMLARAFLVVVTALLLSGCVDSERFRGDYGPRDSDRDYDRSERRPGR
jgi:hypothetical protein